MIRYVFDAAGMNLLREEEASPTCGLHFCETCGACLACCEDEVCIDGGSHYWVVYEEELESE